MIAPYLTRLGITSGQACTLSLGLVLGGVLLATSVPPVWDRRGQVLAPTAATALPEGMLSLPLAPAPAPLVVESAPLPPPGAAPVALGPVIIPGPDAPLADEPLEPEPAGPRPALPPPGPAQQETSLRVIESGYSTSQTGAAMTAGIPADGLPIGARVGSPAEQSYVRLTGTATSLQLAVSAASGASFGPDAPMVQACRIRDDSWMPARPGPAVPFDENACEAGVRGADGKYSFDLSRFPDRSDRRGFALVPRIDGPTRTFRLTLTPARSSS